jgi:hypothetical protein
MVRERQIVSPQRAIPTRSRVGEKNYAVPRLSGLACRDAREITLVDLHFRLNERLLYEYDFRDGWQLQVRKRPCRFSYLWWDLTNMDDEALQDRAKAIVPPRVQMRTGFLQPRFKLTGLEEVLKDDQSRKRSGDLRSLAADFVSDRDEGLVRTVKAFNLMRE